MELTSLRLKNFSRDFLVLPLAPADSIVKVLAIFSGENTRFLLSNLLKKSTPNLFQPLDNLVLSDMLSSLFTISLNLLSS